QLKPTLCILKYLNLKIFGDKNDKFKAKPEDDELEDAKSVNNILALCLEDIT
ncbi:16873_t:CDS:2, partial [Racocetra persica]